MATPILIDTDMGVDDALAIALAFCAPELELRALVATGGNVDRDQALDNIERLLAAIGPRTRPDVGVGLDQIRAGLTDARHVFGPDGLGGGVVPRVDAGPRCGYLEAYESALGDTNDAAIVAIGPLTTLAAVLRERPELLRRAQRIVVMGGALWCKGNVGAAEFNFYRDPPAAAAVLSAGLPVSLVPLDVTRFVTLDESHAARMSASESRAGDVLAKTMAFPMEHSTEAGPGRFIVHDALSVGALLWPQLFLTTEMAIDVTRDGRDAGRTRPRISADAAARVRVLTAVDAPDFLENFLERICHEHFVV